MCMNHDFEKPILWSLELELSLAPGLRSKAGVQSCASLWRATKPPRCFRVFEQLPWGGNSWLLLICVRWGWKRGTRTERVACPLTRSQNRRCHTVLWPWTSTEFFCFWNTYGFPCKLAYRVAYLRLLLKGKICKLINKVYYVSSWNSILHEDY